jgi:hypothetical protein
MSHDTILDDHRVKHLEMIQTVVSRLASHSFLVKGWAVTVAAVFFGLAVNSANGWLALASMVPTLAFWGLDTYFLRSERLFRALYDRVRTSPTNVEPFFMGATSSSFIASISGDSTAHASSWWRTARRPTLVLLYAGLVMSAAVIALAIGR